YGPPAEVFAVIEIRDLRLQNGFRITRRRRNVSHDRFEERTQVLGRIFERSLRYADLRVRVKHGKIELLLLRIEIDEKVVDFVEDFGRAGVRPIDLVDD